jgi:hypothetical protein
MLQFVLTRHSLSRKSDCDDWEIEDFIFKYLDNLWGPHSSDRFAHDYNAKCKQFFSGDAYTGSKKQQIYF